MAAVIELEPGLRPLPRLRSMGSNKALPSRKRAAGPVVCVVGKREAKDAKFRGVFWEGGVATGIPVLDLVIGVWPRWCSKSFSEMTLGERSSELGFWTVEGCGWTAGKGVWVSVIIDELDELELQIT